MCKTISHLCFFYPFELMVPFEYIGVLTAFLFASIGETQCSFMIVVGIASVIGELAVPYLWLVFV